MSAAVQRDELARVQSDFAALRRVNAEQRAELLVLRPLIGKLERRLIAQRNRTSKQRQRAELWKARALKG